MRRKIQSRTLCPGNSLSYVIFSAGLREPAPPHLSGDLRRLDGHLRSGHWYNPHCLLPFLIQYLLSAFAIHYSHRRFSPPSLRPLASGSSPDTAHPPYGGTFVPFFHMECERDSHPRLSPVSFRPIRLLVRNLCLIPQTCLSLCSTAADFFPDSSSTGGVCCVSGRIPAFCDPMSAMHHACRIGVFACVRCITAPNWPSRKVSLPDLPPIQHVPEA